MCAGPTLSFDDKSFPQQVWNMCVLKKRNGMAMKLVKSGELHGHLRAVGQLPV